MSAKQLQAIRNKLQKKPYDYSTHLAHINLIKDASTKDEGALDEAREMMAKSFPLPADIWVAWLNEKQTAYKAKRSAETLLALLGLYQRAFQDILVISIYENFARLLIEEYYHAYGIIPRSLEDANEDGMDVEPQPSEGDEDMKEVISEDLVRVAMNVALERVGWYLTESHKIWDQWRDWEMQLLLRDISNVERIERIQNLYQTRLSVPHSTIENTFALYSTFISRYLNTEYETHLVAANKAYAPSLEKWQQREPWEDKLVSSQLSYEVFLDYLKTEETAKTQDVNLTKMLYERSIDLHQSTHPHLWEDYIHYLVNRKESDVTISAVATTATRFQPFNGVLWAERIKAMEKEKKDDPYEGLTDAEQLYNTAVETGLMTNRVDDIVAVTIAIVDCHRRMIDFLIKGGAGIEPTLVDAVIKFLEEGRERVKKADKKKGDPLLRLEKYLTTMYERFDKSTEALELWQAVTKSPSHKASATAWMIRTELEARWGLTNQAHESFKAALSNKLDYPEYILDKWIEFEHCFGTLEDLEHAQARAKKLRAILAKKREQEYAAAWGLTAASSSLNEVISSGTTIANGGQNDVVVTTEETGESGVPKRKDREEESEEQNAKRIKMAHELPPPPENKRDRENATVFITGLPAGVSEDKIQKLFRDCGIIREIKTYDQVDKVVASVEFTDPTSIPAAQTKDKKKVDGHEISVNLAWQSTLYVTNFAEDATDDDIRKLFSPYGTLLDVRWPSRRLKSTRRFVYVQYLSPSSAQSALVLNKFESSPGLRMSVAISAPEKKKERTDAGANDRELFVNGLSRFVNEEDLRKLFSSYGIILGIRLPVDDQGHAKGFAFIDFDEETSAKAALSLNNYELKKRRIAVTIADAKGASQKATTRPNRQARRQEGRNRSIRIRKVPVNTQEAIIQQTFEKFGKVKQVVYQLGSDEAVLEFEAEADVGKLLLSKEAIKIGDSILDYAAEGIVGDVKRHVSIERSTSPEVKASTSAVPATNMGMMPRTVASRSRGRLGVVRGAGRLSGVTSVKESGQKPKGNDDFRKMLVD